MLQPPNLSLEERFPVGASAEFEHLITSADVARFVEITGDDNALHVDRAFAETTSFKGPVVHGMLSASFLSTIVGKHLPGSGALWISQSLEFLLPVRVGDRLRIRAEVTAVHATRQILELKAEIWNQNRQLVLTGASKVKVLKSETAGATEAALLPDRRVAIITGGSRGIGAETARQLARSGFAVVIGYRTDEDGARRVIQEIEDEKGRGAAVRADVCREEDLQELVRVAVSSYGGISAVVNNASDPLVYRPIASLKSSDLARQMDVQFHAAFNLIQAALPYLEQSSNAAVVNVSSTAADNVPPAQLLPYAAAKAALVSMTKSFAVEYGPKKIRFNLVSAGMTDTKMVASIPEKARMIARMQTPLRQLATPADVACGIAFLLSPGARHITGETLRICGGAVML